MIARVAKSATALAVIAAMALVALLAGHGQAGMRSGSELAALGGGLRLVMVDDPACGYCRKWDAEVGIGYPKSAEGRRAPLVKRNKRHADLEPYKPLIYTPTFLLVDSGTEVGRIVGYPGPDFFYAELERLLAKVADRVQPGDRGPIERDARLRSALQPG
jgi:hypothetical protein